MRAQACDRARLEAEARRLADRLAGLGARKVFLFGSLARGEVSLFSDIDLLVLFDEDRPSRELTMWVYKNIESREGVDILAYSGAAFRRAAEKPFLRSILKDAKVLYERPRA